MKQKEASEEVKAASMNWRSGMKASKGQTAIK